MKSHMIFEDFCFCPPTLNKCGFAGMNPLTYAVSTTEGMNIIIHRHLNPQRTILIGYVCMCIIDILKKNYEKP